MYGEKVVLHREYSANYGEGVDTLSAREYAHYEMPGVRVDNEQDFRPDRTPVTIHLYVDTVTGVMVSDVALYEESLGLEPTYEPRYY
jgi:hypothetical protein